jgi:hypothetical protein
VNHPFRPRRLADILVQRGFAAAGRIPEAERDAGLGERLVRDGVISAEQLAQALGDGGHRELRVAVLGPPEM